MSTTKEMTLEEFIMAFDPNDCCACSQFGFSWPPPLHSGFLDDLRMMIEECDPNDSKPLITFQDIAELVDNEHERADCIVIWETFEKVRADKHYFVREWIDVK